jgi:hypothetical protein
MTARAHFLSLIELDRLIEFVQGVIERVDGRFLVTAEIGWSSLEPILDGFDLSDGALKNRVSLASGTGGGFLPGLREDGLRRPCAACE